MCSAASLPRWWNTRRTARRCRRHDAARPAIDHLERSRRRDGPSTRESTSRSRASTQCALTTIRKPSRCCSADQRRARCREASVLLARAETALGHPERGVAAVELAADGNPRLLAALAQFYEGQQRWAMRRTRTSSSRRWSPASHDVKTRWADSAIAAGDIGGGGHKRRGTADGGHGERANRSAPAVSLVDGGAKAARLRGGGSGGTAAHDARSVECDRSVCAGAGLRGPAAVRQGGRRARAGCRAHQRRRRGGTARLARAAGASWLRAVAGGPGRRGQDLRARAFADGSGTGFDTSLIQAYLLARQYDQRRGPRAHCTARQPNEPR